MDAPQEFKIPRMAKGKPETDAAGEPVYDTYVYDFNQMGMDRLLSAETFFKFQQHTMLQPPKTPDELRFFVACKHEFKAFAAILMKQKPDKSFELYDPAVTEFSAEVMSHLGKGEDYDRLKECKLDFFQRAGLQLTELTLQSNAIMQQQGSIMQEIIRLGKEAGVEGLEASQKFAEMILDKAMTMETPDNSPSSSTEKSSSAMTNTGASGASLSLGK